MAGLVGCGGSTVADVTKKQSDAVNAAAASTCSRYKDCNEIASGKMYTTADECTTAEKGKWNDRWTVSDCDGKVNGSNLQVCLDAIAQTACGTVLPVDAITKCQKSDVCNGG